MYVVEILAKGRDEDEKRKKKAYTIKKTKRNIIQPTSPFVFSHTHTKKILLLLYYYIHTVRKK